MPPSRSISEAPISSRACAWSWPCGPVNASAVTSVIAYAPNSNLGRRGCGCSGGLRCGGNGCFGGDARRPLLGRKPCLIFRLGQPFDRDRQDAVPGSAKFGTLALIHARPGHPDTNLVSSGGAG